MNKKLNIVLVADPELPIPPRLYGGIERIVHMLAEGLHERGHTVSLLANPRSEVSCELVPLPSVGCTSVMDVTRNANALWKHVRKRGDVHVVHSFGRLAYMLPLMPSRLPKVQSYQRFIAPRSVRIARLLGGGSIHFTACSANCARTSGAGHESIRVIPNGVPALSYDFVPGVDRDAPLVFLGRVERIKGVHTAIRVARSAGRGLVIAGNRAESGTEYDYFRTEVEPHINGGDIEYVGPVDDSQKNRLLGSAAALLFPIEWEEPFGIVMAEALACGTPVIAYRRGAVPEVVEDGVTGFVCDDEQGMVKAVGDLSRLRREDCRRAFEQRFSSDVITGLYEGLYSSIVQPAGGRS